MTRSPRHARRGPPGGSTLAPLRWVAQEELVYDRAALTLRAAALETVRGVGYRLGSLD